MGLTLNGESLSLGDFSHAVAILVCGLGSKTRALIFFNQLYLDNSLIHWFLDLLPMRRPPSFVSSKADHHAISIRWSMFKCTLMKDGSHYDIREELRGLPYRLPSKITGYLRKPEIPEILIFTKKDVFHNRKLALELNTPLPASAA